MKTTNDESNLEQFPKLNRLGIFVGNALVNIWVIGSISSKKLGSFSTCKDLEESICMRFPHVFGASLQDLFKGDNARLGGPIHPITPSQSD